MKKNILLIHLCLFFIGAAAQDAGLPPRPYKPEEMKRWSQVCEWLSNALPSSYKDYTVRHLKCGEFEWAEINKDHQPLTVIDKRNQPIGNNPYYRLWFDMNEDSATEKYNDILREILAAKNEDGTFDPEKMKAAGAAETKFNETKTVFIEVRTNVKVDFDKQYYVGLKPEKIVLPIDAFGYLYLFPKGKLMLDENGESLSGTDGNSFYRDKALVFISSKLPKVVVNKIGGKSTWTEDKIFPQDNAPFTSLSPVINISVEIYGAEKDVRELIKMIDWKGLKSLIGK